MKRYAFATVLLLLVMLPVVAQAAPAQGSTEDPPSFDAFLQALSGPLVAISAGLLLSVVIEYWPAYDALAAKWKRVIFFGLCLVIPVTAALLRAVLGYVPWSFDPLIWTAIWNGLGAAGVGTLSHTRKLGGGQ